MALHRIPSLRLSGFRQNSQKRIANVPAGSARSSRQEEAPSKWAAEATHATTEPNRQRKKATAATSSAGKTRPRLSVDANIQFRRLKKQLFDCVQSVVCDREVLPSFTIGSISELPKSFFVLSGRGSIQLSIDGYVFTQELVKNNDIDWACSQSKALRCKVRATTSRDKDRKVLSIRGEHNHAVITERRKSGALKALLEQRKKERDERRMRLSGARPIFN